jgi:hypothetical protein
MDLDQNYVVNPASLYSTNCRGKPTTLHRRDLEKRPCQQATTTYASRHISNMFYQELASHQHFKRDLPSSTFLRDFMLCVTFSSQPGAELYGARQENNFHFLYHFDGGIITFFFCSSRHNFDFPSFCYFLSRGGSPNGAQYYSSLLPAFSSRHGYGLCWYILALYVVVRGICLIYGVSTYWFLSLTSILTSPLE